MNINEAAKCLSGMSQKLIPKDDSMHGFISFVHKEGKTFLALSNDKFSCVVPIVVNHNVTENLHCMIDGKMLSKVLQKSNIDSVELQCSVNIEGKPSAITLKSDVSTSVSIPVSGADHSIRQKKLSSSHYVIDRECFVSSLKSTINAGSDIDAERPYYYLLLKFDEERMSCTCGNGSFFAHVECKAVKNNSAKDYCLIPIPVALSIIPFLDQCEDDEVKISFDDHSFVIHGECMKFSLSIDRKCVVWPDTTSILNRKTGSICKIESAKIRDVASNIELAAEGYDSKNETLKCKLNISKTKMSFFINGYCKVESSIEIDSDLDTEKDIVIDAACIPLSLKSKMLGSFIYLNIDDSSFKGRPSPIVISSDSKDCCYKTFFAVS